MTLREHEIFALMGPGGAGKSTLLRTLSGLNDGLGYMEYFYPGILVMLVLFASIFGTISVIEDRHEGGDGATDVDVDGGLAVFPPEFAGPPALGNACVGNDEVEAATEVVVEASKEIAGTVDVGHV